MLQMAITLLGGWIQNFPTGELVGKRKKNQQKQAFQTSRWIKTFDGWIFMKNELCITGMSFISWLSVYEVSVGGQLERALNLSSDARGWWNEQILFVFFFLFCLLFELLNGKGKTGWKRALRHRWTTLRNVVLQFSAMPLRSFPHCWTKECFNQMNFQ